MTTDRDDSGLKREIEAWKLSHTLSIWSKKRVTIGKLLGRHSINAADYGSVEAFRTALREAREDSKNG